MQTRPKYCFPSGPGQRTVMILYAESESVDGLTCLIQCAQPSRSPDVEYTPQALLFSVNFWGRSWQSYMSSNGCLGMQRLILCHIRSQDIHFHLENIVRLFAIGSHRIVVSIKLVHLQLRPPHAVMYVPSREGLSGSASSILVAVLLVRSHVEWIWALEDLTPTAIEMECPE